MTTSIFHYFKVTINVNSEHRSVSLMNQETYFIYLKSILNCIYKYIIRVHCTEHRYLPSTYIEFQKNPVEIFFKNVSTNFMRLNNLISIKFTLYLHLRLNCLGYVFK